MSAARLRGFAKLGKEHSSLHRGATLPHWRTLNSSRAEGDPQAAVDAWLEANRARVDQFANLVRRARQAAVPNAAMLAQIAGQARVLLGR